MKALKWIALSLAGLLLIAAAVVAWLVGTESGTRTAARIAQHALGEKLHIGSIEGPLAGPLVLTNVHYRDPGAGIDLGVRRIAIDVVFADLFRTLMHFQDAQLDGVDVALSEPTEPPKPMESEPFTLQPPIDVAIDSLVVTDAKVRRDAATLIELTRTAFKGHWTHADLGVERLEVESPQGQVTFAGSVRQQEAYVGKGHGRFSWKVGERTFACALATAAEGGNTNLTLELSAPVAARLRASVKQTETWPWRFSLEAPRFDPRDELLPDSSLYSLAASLSGEGSLDHGQISGQLLVNDEPLQLDPLRFARTADVLRVDSTLRVGKAAGEVRVRGDIDLANQPVSASVDAKWSEMVLPAVWVGQELHTHGQLAFRGSAQSYRATGSLGIGPAQRVADIALDLHGTPELIELQQFDIVQKKGRLAAHGRVDLQPQLAWNVSATANGFDPGAFAAAWRGRLDFDLASQGRVTDEGPSATVALKNLKGELRGRALSGNADLSLTPALVPSGTLAINSGRSELRLRGAPGDRIDANVSLHVASLDDWLPNSGGELQAAFVVRGRWPDLAIEGDARGNGLHAANVRIETLTVGANMKQPRDPSGSLRLDLTKLAAAGFELKEVHASAAGGSTDHCLQVRATGEPLAFEIALQGARKEAGWSGSLQNLVIDVKDAARLALREPAHIELGKGSAEISRACLTDRTIELCAAGAMQPDGAMHASYSLANIPLALANVVASEDLPLQLEGTIQGQGEIRRTPQGELFGNAVIQSPSGRISRKIAVAGEQTAEPPQTLLSYHDLRIAANLSGPDARTSVSMQFEPNGSLRGEATLHGLGQPETNVAGQLNSRIPDLAPLAVFAPQLANVHGHAEADISIAGTLQAPQLSGLVSAAELAADVPQVGLHLKNGQLQARPESTGDIALSGGIESGPGRVQLTGRATRAGMIDMNVKGERVLAADMPGAHVLVTPDLNFKRASERMTLSGQVTIPEATIDLQKLPRGGEHVQAASSDVVVIDAQTREDESRQMPLFAEITVNIGDKVELSGFGLQARVDGRLDVREAPGQPTLGSGGIRVAGKYKAYGQDLTIERGQLLYAWTPLENPRLNIEATRKVDEVVAGLRIRGSAQAPELTVFSDPPMGQSNALAYLVTGKPLDSIGSNSGDADAMQQAARQLSVAAGGLLAKNLGKRLGLAEFGVKDEEMIGGSALTVGQYLSPRLYLSYGVGLFEPGDVVTLRYKLSEELALQTQRGPSSTRTGIEYRIEK